MCSLPLLCPREILWHHGCRSLLLFVRITRSLLPPRDHNSSLRAFHDPLSIVNIDHPFSVSSLDSRSQPLKYPSGLFRKLTTRFKPPTLHPKSANPETASPPTSPTQPSTRRPVVPIASTHVAAMKRRQAALQQCGLVPLPRKDLSQLEAELDRRFTRVVVLPQDEQDQAELSSAERIRREWQAKNEVQSVKQGDDAHSKDPNDVPSDSLNLENEEAQRVPSPPDPAFSLQNPVSLPPIPETFSIPEVSEEDVATSKNAKVYCPVMFNRCLLLANTLYRKS